MKDLQKIAKRNQAMRIRFKSGKTEMVDHYTASAISQVYSKVNKQNQTKMEKAVETLPGFMKVMDFAMSKVN
jgi:DNA-binding protein YbaB